jgi:hypothetical protein
MNHPIHQASIGHVRAAIWANQRDGRMYYSVKFERSYKQEDEWKSTPYFGRDDLLPLAKLADHVHTWIVAAIERDRVGDRQQPESMEHTHPVDIDADEIPF